MARRNRVTPLGELVADPARGLVYGNRGCLVDAHAELRRAFQVQRWIACRLEFNGRRRRPLMAPGRYTELFFLDDATALAAGHRACAECRRVDYRRVCEVLGMRADAIDARLQGERWAGTARTGRRRLGDRVRVAELPDGAFVADRDGAPWLVCGAELLRWTVRGYTDRVPVPARSRMTLITPPALVEVLRAGWDPVVPLLHPSARR
jgi:hypothetical protein